MKDPLSRTKVVIRHLPPSLSQSDLFQQIDDRFNDRYNWFCFRPGKNRFELFLPFFFFFYRYRKFGQKICMCLGFCLLVIVFWVQFIVYFWEFFFFSVKFLFNFDGILISVSGIVNEVCGIKLRECLDVFFF